MGYSLFLCDLEKPVYPTDCRKVLKYLRQTEVFDMISNTVKL